MGTRGDWGQIAAIAVFLGLYWWARDIGHKPYPNKLGRALGGWFLISTALCIWWTFPLQAFRVPLVFITAPAAVGGVILVYFARPRGSQQAATEPSADHDK
jgi:hypothetical protein